MGPLLWGLLLTCVWLKPLSLGLGGQPWFPLSPVSLGESSQEVSKPEPGRTETFPGAGVCWHWGPRLNQSGTLDSLSGCMNKG